MYKQMPHFPNCYNQMLCTIYVRLQVGMSTHSSSLNFCRSKETKIQQNLKCHNVNGGRMQMEFKCKWNSSLECMEERRNCKKFAKEIFMWTMKPPHCLTWKCQKLSQLPSSWTLALEVTLNENHQQQIRT